MENICGLGGGAFVRRYQITMCKFPARRPDKRVFLGDGGRYENGNEAAPGRSGFPGAGEQHKHVVNSVFLIARGNKQRSRARSSPSSRLFFSARGPLRLIRFSGSGLVGTDVLDLPSTLCFPLSYLLRPLLPPDLCGQLGIP